jgi:hypothetical protein
MMVSPGVKSWGNETPCSDNYTSVVVIVVECRTKAFFAYHSGISDHRVAVLL